LDPILEMGTIFLWHQVHFLSRQSLPQLSGLGLRPSGYDPTRKVQGSSPPWPPLRPAGLWAGSGDRSLRLGEPDGMWLSVCFHIMWGRSPKGVAPNPSTYVYVNRFTCLQIHRRYYEIFFAIQKFNILFNIQ